MTTQALTIKDDMSLSQLGDVFVKSGFFADTREAAQAVVKILAGRELGFGPIASMTGVNIIKGRVSVSANLMAAAVKRHAGGKYNYRVAQLDDTACDLAFYEGKVEVGHSVFTLQDARKAGTQNMEKYPRNMLFARAMSNGVKWYCADVFGGPIYTPEEMGAKVDEDGDVVEMPAVVAKAEPVGTLDLSKPNGHMAPAARPTPADAQLDAMIEEAEAAPVPAPVATETKAPRASSTASMKIRQPANQKTWQAGCKALALKFPDYQTELKSGDVSGLPDYYHILGAAKKCLFDTVTDDNYQAVLAAIEARAGEAVAA